MAHDRTSAFLSFCLPGLGQLYQRRVAFTAGTFAIFCLLALGGGFTRGLLPLWAIAAGWEALRHPPVVPASETLEATRTHRRRRGIFAIFGVVGFLFWFAMVGGSWFPVETQMKADEAAGRMAEALRQCRGSHAQWPLGLADCPAVPRLTDPYGHAFEYRRSDAGFELLSAGRDGQLGTADDFHFHFR